MKDRNGNEVTVGDFVVSEQGGNRFKIVSDDGIKIGIDLRSSAGEGRVVYHSAASFESSLWVLSKEELTPYVTFSIPRELKADIKLLAKSKPRRTMIAYLTNLIEEEKRKEGLL